MKRFLVAAGLAILTPAMLRAECGVRLDMTSEYEEAERGVASTAQNVNEHIAAIMEIERSLAEVAACPRDQRPSSLALYALASGAIARVKLSREKLAAIKRWRDTVGYEPGRGEAPRYVSGGAGKAAEHPAAKALFQRLNQMELLREARQRACNTGGIARRAARIVLDCSADPAKARFFEASREQVQTDLAQLSEWLDAAQRRLEANTFARPPSQLDGRVSERVERRVAEGAPVF